MNKGLPILLTMTILSGIALSSSVASADTEVVDTIELTVPVACTMSGTGTTHTATLSPGTYSGASGNEYENGIGKTTLTAICNDDNGFSIYAIGFTGNEYGVTNLVGENTSGTIATKAYASGDTTSNWSMKLTKVDNPISGDPVTYNPENLTIETGYNTWHAVPADYTKVAEYHANTGSSTTDTTLGVKLETTYAAYIASNQAADTYVGQVKYTMVHPYDAATPIIPVSIADATTMQEVNSCPADLPEEQVYTLTDTRDTQTYKVAKLRDGKCWMVENLNIAGGTALSSEDTDFDSSYALPTTNGWTVTNGKLVLPASATKNDANNNLTDSTQFSTVNYAYVFNSGNKTNCGGSGQNTPCYSYYSLDAATLGSSRTLATRNTDATYSICPKNWKLPTSRYTNMFDATTAQGSDTYNLATSYGMSAGAWSQSTSNFYTQAGPGTTPGFLLAGFYGGGSFYYGGSLGLYQSATSSCQTAGGGCLLDLSSNSISSTSGAGSGGGYSVRCLLKTN